MCLNQFLIAAIIATHLLIIKIDKSQWIGYDFVTVKSIGLEIMLQQLQKKEKLIEMDSRQGYDFLNEKHNIQVI